MKNKVIKTEKEYNAALERADKIFSAKKGSSAGDELELLLLLIKNYEDKHHNVPVPDAIQVLKMKMEERGWINKDLEKLLGSKSYVSQILNKRKPLSAQVMKILHKELGIPANVLLAA